MSKFIVGLHVGHNASACIGDQNGLAFAIQEERLTGEKNYWGFPRKSIEACMKAVGAGKADLLGIAVGSRFILHRYHSREDVVESYENQRGGLGFLRMAVAVPLALTLYPKYGQAEVGQGLRECGLEGVPVEFYDHHRSHAASAYYGLRRDPAKPYLVVTCDGSGDRLSGSMRVWSGKGEKLIAAIADTNSLGAIYALATHAMGFVPLEHEYKLMGMAPYASSAHAEEAKRLFENYLELDEESLTFRRKGKAPTYLLLKKILSDISGRRFDTVCAGLQRFTEDILTQWIAKGLERTGLSEVLAAGGVFMNVKANKVIAGHERVHFFEAFPSCGDETLSMGAFWLDAARHFGDENVKPLAHLYLGDDLAAEETEEALRQAGYSFDKPADMADTVAELLSRGEPVARCSGRMEFGARALCNRSILADPRNQDVVRVINQMVKKRDFWMPFAPVILRERQHEYIENEKDLRSPYMMMTFDTKENLSDMIAAVHNADLTCRAQLLEPGQNPEVEAIMAAFSKRTGRAVLLNTSFNLHGFPIVRTAADALHVFKNSGLQFMQLGEYLVRKTA
jgi:carbamoyltransferase